MTAECPADASVASLPSAYLASKKAYGTTRKRKRHRPDVRSLEQLDGRTRVARTAAALIKRLTSQLEGGAASAAQGELIQRCALLSVLAGDAEIAILAGKTIDVHAYVAIVNAQRRVLQTIGIVADPKLVDGTATRLAKIEGPLDVLARYLEPEEAKP